MRRTSLRRAAALVPVAALGLATLSVTSPAGAADPPKVNIGNVTISEGDAGGPNTMKLPVTLSEPAGGDVLVQWTITPGTASAGIDYTALKKPKVTKIKAGKTAAFAAVKELPDLSAEGDETFTVTIDSVTGPAVAGTHTVGTGTILDDDGPTATQVSVGDSASVETNTGLPKLALPFTLSSPLATGEVWVTWTVVPGTADPLTDYKGPKKPKVTKIKAGKTSAQATIPVIGDLAPESDETFTVVITDVTVVGTGSATALRTTGTGTIVDDDTVADPTEAPGAPTNVVASRGAGTIVNVIWDAPTTGDAPTQYNFEYTDDAGANWHFVGNGGPAPRSFSMSVFDGSYQFRIQAENSGGQSAWSSPSNVLIVLPPVVNPPGAPTNVVASLTVENFAHVVWTAPTTGDAPTGYNYEYSANGGATWLNLGGGGPETTQVTSELGPGTYVFHIQAENSGGLGPWSAQSNPIVVPENSCDPFCPG